MYFSLGRHTALKYMHNNSYLHHSCKRVYNGKSTLAINHIDNLKLLIRKSN